ncbi:MAG: hypothetical protein Ct9H300mP14_12140 [Gammaproteobacteria bacterium]|nr:MAG: hypothetical protein Ct9H300mP14_12140 [Gammaproteobacteria bacterium]
MLESWFRGGALGAGLLYYLTKKGWTDVVLVEKGGVDLGFYLACRRVDSPFYWRSKYGEAASAGSELYKQLEAETGQATGWHGCGAIRLGLTDDEVDWFRYVKGFLDYLNIESHLLSPLEILEVPPISGRR